MIMPRMAAEGPKPPHSKLQRMAVYHL